MADVGTSASLLKSANQAEAEGLSIPLIDLAPLLSPNATYSDRRNTGRSILSAFEDYGFLYLSSLPSPFPVLTSVFAHSAAFFARPQQQKDSLAWTTPQSNRGYVTFGREKVTNTTSLDEVAKEREANPDLKESMDIGREGEEGHPNRWPDGLDEEGRKFKEVMIDVFQKCKEMHRVVMSAIALGLGYDEHFFDPFVARGDNTLRLLHYPPVRKGVFEKNKDQVRAGAHSDYGSITLLFQDDKGGLQVEGMDGQWKDVTPIEGTVVVNAGDLLARWSNDRIKSTKHRVVEPPLKKEQLESLDEYPSRYSIAYFCNPDFDKMIEALPETWETTGKKYEPVNSGDYLVQRLTSTF